MMRSFALLALVALCALASCDRTRHDIVGKWKTSSGGGEVVWDFQANGTVSTGGAPGRYTFGDNRRIKIQTPSATFVYQFQISGDKMVWTDPRGGSTELTRVNP